MAIGADEVNLLIHRYLQESGFRHSAFTFGHESLLARTAAVESDLPYGSLVGLLQKGLQYLEIERQVREDGTEANHDHSTGPFDDAKTGEAVATDTITVLTGETASILRGHKGEVSCCAFDPRGDTLATGGADGTARLWRGVASAAASAASAPAGPPVVVTVAPPSAATGSSSSAAASSSSSSAPAAPRDVGSAVWSPDGSLLACAGHSGHVRVLTRAGSDAASLRPHASVVLAAAFSPAGDRLATCGLDGRVALHDCDDWTALPAITSHRAPVLDVAWQSDSVVASCSTDRTVQVHRVASDRAPRVFTGHTAEVNRLSWDATRSILASCSDDATVRLWSAKDGLLFTLEGHEGPVHSVEWSPGGDDGRGYAASAPLVASASADHGVRIWDANTCACRATLRGHAGVVVSARFSPDGSLLASGSFDRRVVVWSVAEGRPVRTFEGAGGVLSLDWHSAGRVLAATFSDGSAAVMDVGQG